MSRFATAFWAAVVVLALVPIGFGIAREMRAPRAVPPMPTPVPSAPRVDAVVLAQPAGDEPMVGAVVVDRAPSPNADGSARIAIVAGPLGASAAVDGAFLRAGVPVAALIDPALPQAAADAQLAAGSGDPVYVLAQRAPDPRTLAGWSARLGTVAGVASAADAGMAVALRGRGLAFLDLRGDADAAPFARAGVPLVRRDLTLDDRDESGYVRYMFEQAVALGEERGTAVAWLHPRSAGLAALRDFAGSHARDVVPLDENTVRVGGPR